MTFFFSRVYPYTTILVVHQFLTTYEKAYDSVKREVFYSILAEFVIPIKLVRGHNNNT
jgi:hypothetical protein